MESTNVKMPSSKTPAHDHELGIETRANKAQDENKIKIANLSHAKDRAQITSAGAMSIMNIALLKELLDYGDQNPHYKLLMGLVCSSLILQILTGFLSIFVAQMTKYYSQYKDDLCDDFMENICCCKIQMRKDDECHDEIYSAERYIAMANETTKGAENKGKSSLDTPVQLQRVEPLGHSKRLHSISHQSSRPLCSCCPLEVTTKLLDKNESDILKKYEYLKGNMIDAELAAAEAYVKAKSIEQEIIEAKTKLVTLTAQKEKYELAEFQQKAQEIQDAIDISNDKMKLYNKVKNNLAVLNGQEEVLQEQADMIMKNQILKSVSFWQSGLNYLLYSIFILNAFITGLWVQTPRNVILPQTNATFRPTI